MNTSGVYTTLKEFMLKYHSQGFEHVSRLDSFIVAMEDELRSSNQFFYIADLLKIRILFTSWGSQKMIGVSPDLVDTSTFFVLAHPEDQERLNQAQAKLYRQGQDLFIKEEGISIVSIKIRLKNDTGTYIGAILQTYSFFSEIHKTVFTLILATELSSSKLDRNADHHFYAGDDVHMFRNPDEILLKEGGEFSKREFEIIRLIAKGMGSEQIADKLSLSATTVATHRRNILKKTTRSTTHALVIELRQKGML